jgi:hypothetical protein
LPETLAAYINSKTNGQPVIAGYLNANRQALPGEFRIYAVDDNGNEVAYAWLRKTGVLEVNGTAYNAVRYAPLDTALQDMAAKINAENVKIAAAITLLGGSYTPATVTVDISGAETNKVTLP